LITHPTTSLGDAQIEEDAVHSQAGAPPVPSVHGRCAEPGCPFIAEVVLSDPDGDELDVCRDHWHDALDHGDGRIRGVRLIRRPECFLSGCGRPAAAAIEDDQGLPRPVCPTHGDDLRWLAATDRRPSLRRAGAD
jgi:hypothetical protein